MTYTQAEYDALRTAYLALLKGEKAVEVSKGDKRVRYTEANVSALRREISLAEMDLGLTFKRVYAQNGGRSS